MGGPQGTRIRGSGGSLEGEVVCAEAHTPGDAVGVVTLREKRVAVSLPGDITGRSDLQPALCCARGWGLMQTRSVGGAGVRWDVGDTGGLEGYEGLRGETDTRDSILALITPG